MAFLSHHIPLFFMKTALLLLSFHVLCCSSQNNTMFPSQSISQNQTLISENGKFALGFFSPTDPPSKYYLGIWFHQIPNRTVVWVCNRETPLMDPSSGALAITSDGNIAVLDTTKKAILWSTSISAIPTNTSAVLLNSGNLILQTGANSNIIWQSFDHPSDTLLADMKLWMNLSTRAGNRLVSWRAPHDPSPSEFSLGFDPVTALQIMVWRGTQVWTRSSVWAGATIGTAQDEATSSFAVLVLEFVNATISYSIRMTEGSTTLWTRLDPAGMIRYLLWDQTSNAWRAYTSKVGPCSYYNRCGPNAYCNSNSTTLDCVCLRGYGPKSPEEWRVGNYSGGCGRVVELGCGNGDGFVKMSGLILPDGFRLVRDASREECELGCLGNCSCAAYAYSNTSVIGSSTRCLVWGEELVDIKAVNGTGDPGEELYLRLGASELETHGSSSKRIRVTIAIIVPLLALGMILLGSYLCIHKKRPIPKEKSETVLFEELQVPEMIGEKRSKDLLALDFYKLLVATNNFSKENKLGEGGFGPVYKGKLTGGQEIAIKTLSSCSSQGFEQFSNEVKLIVRLQHTNLVKLLGWCIHGNEMMLIYEYMPNKSLDKFIFDASLKAKLDWAKRFRIIHGIAQGILYLHRYSRLRVIHRDLKTSNILLDEDMNPKISDFGLAKIIEKNQTAANTERVIGTLGYMSPEYAFDGLFSEKSDVFSFGVILLEIITGRKGTGFYPYKKSFNLLGYVWEHWKECRSLDLVDASMGKEFSAPSVLRCFQIALLCVQESAFDRPSMSLVVSMLSTENASLPSPNQPAFSAERYPHSAFPLPRSFVSLTTEASTSTGFMNGNTLMLNSFP